MRRSNRRAIGVPLGDVADYDVLYVVKFMMNSMLVLSLLM